MQQLLWIGIAGGAGAVLRYLVHQGTVSALGSGFPYGTLVVNALGSFAIGLLFVLFGEKSVAGETMRLALMVGLLGGFTTFSAFSLDTWMLLEQGAPLKAAVNVLASVATCLLVTWLGITAARMI